MSFQESVLCRLVSLQRPAALLQLLSMLSVAIVVAACSGGAPGPPPGGTLGPEQFQYRMYMLHNTSNQQRAAPISDVDGEKTDAQQVWRNECQIEILQLNSTEDIKTPFSNGKHPWEIYMKNSDGTLADSAMALVQAKPTQEPIVHVFIVRRLFRTNPKTSVTDELGGATVKKSNGSGREPYVWLSGFIIAHNRNILAHEFGHIMNLGDVTISSRLMYEKTPPGNNLSSDECNTARSSSYSQP